MTDDDTEIVGFMEFRIIHCPYCGKEYPPPAEMDVDDVRPWMQGAIKVGREASKHLVEVHGDTRRAKMIEELLKQVESTLYPEQN